MRRTATLVSVAMLIAAPLALAQGSGSQKPAQPENQAEVKSLTVGDKAPALTVGKWIKGEPITGFEKGRIYVIDCWATWCGPCIAAIPHMTETQHKYEDKGVTVMGVSMFERDFGRVAPFVAGKGDDMGYHVAIDDVPALPEGTEVGTAAAQRWAGQKGKMAQNWMTAAKRNFIPNIFIVDREGRVAYIGSPDKNMDAALEQIVAGTYDIKKAAADFAAGQNAEVRVNTAATTLNKSIAEFQAALKAGESDRASRIGRDLIAGAGKGNPMVLNTVAWSIVDPEAGVKHKDLSLALDAATQACEATKWSDGAILDTLALVCFEQGNVDKAIEYQTKAVSLVANDTEMADEAKAQMKAELQGRLDQFKAAKK
ncbi:MAG: redoxin family protein [Phycisphaerales bacterium]|nr:redoxin family protein [Phycisphaerales bacterium]